MQHVAVKATVAEVTDLGEFTALAATWSVDRVRDQIVRGAFEKTIAAWRASGKKVPVHWNHSGAAQDIIGAIDPAAMRETDEGLYVAGKLDLDESEVARQAWRSMKNNAVSLSFGYLATKTRKRKDGVQELLEIDLFEVTVAPGPANPETRFLSLKAVAERTVPTDAQLRAKAKRLGVEPPLTHTQLRRKSDAIALEAALGFQPLPNLTAEPPKSVPTEAELRRRTDAVALDMALGWAPPPQPAQPEAKAAPPTDAELRAQAAELGLALPPRRRAVLGPDFAAIKDQARAEMLALFHAADEQAGQA